MKVENIVAVNGTYKNKQGEEKKQYVTVGKLLTNDEGKQSIKMECIPIGRDGWGNAYPIVKKEGSSFNSDPTGDLPF